MNNKTLKLTLLSVIIISLIFSIFIFSSCFSQTNARTEIKIPDILGYITLKCDFHMHTVFSDGSVWPTVRVEEAWREGLDAISITDHIEHQYHKKDVTLDHNLSYELAKSKATELGLILIKGAEITRSMPPGHFNAIFLKDVDPLDTEDWRDAIKAANEQGAFVFWNHPGWEAQAPNGAKWYDEHTELYEQGQFQGIEIVNWMEYYPTVHRWALDKKLTLIGNSDVHPPIQMDFDLANGEHRPLTIVFAKEKSVEAIKDALLARRTAVYYQDLLLGEEKFLKPIFRQSIEIVNPTAKIKKKGIATIQIHNKSDLILELVTDSKLEEITIPPKINLYPDKTVLFHIKGKSNKNSGKKLISIPYNVKNLSIAPDICLSIEFKIEVNFISEE